MPSRSAPPASSHAGPPPNGNRILAAIAAKELARLRPHLTTVTLEQRHPAWQPNEPFREIYFPLDAVVSVLAVAGHGVVEVATIGNEGVVGLPAFLGAETSPGMAFCQVPGRAERMTIEVFLREARKDGPFRRVLQLYTQGFVAQVSQSTRLQSPPLSRAAAGTVAAERRRPGRTRGVSPHPRIHG